jgi:aminopeptidase-like protein
MSPKGEPRLGKRGLYGTVGGRSPADRERAMLWVLNQSDGGASLLDIAARSGMDYADIRMAGDELHTAGLLAATDAAAAVTRRRRQRPAAKSKRKGERK